MTSKSRKRRRWTSEEKLRIVVAGLDGTIEISELCRREGINPTQYYGWKKQLLSSAGRVFDNGSAKPSAKQQRLESDLVWDPASRRGRSSRTRRRAEEKAAVRAYALKHPEMQHRELAWRMVDEDVVCLSPSTVYRILRAEKLVCPWRRRKKRYRQKDEKAQRPDQIWATDIKYVSVGGRNYYLISFLDEYSRYIVHHELLRGMDGHSVSLAAQAAVENLPRNAQGNLVSRPDIRSRPTLRVGARGSGYISREFGAVLDEHGLSHRRITPHCPEENGVMERAIRTLARGDRG